MGPGTTTWGPRIYQAGAYSIWELARPPEQPLPLSQSTHEASSSSPATTASSVLRTGCKPARHSSHETAAGSHHHLHTSLQDESACHSQPIGPCSQSPTEDQPWSSATSHSSSSYLRGPWRAGRGHQGPLLPPFLHKQGNKLERERDLRMVTEHRDHKQASVSQLGHPSIAAQAKSGAPGRDTREGSPRAAEPWPGAQTGISLLSHGGPPDTFMGIPPERNHFVDFQGTGPTGTSWASLQGTILHLGQEVLGKGAAHIEVVTILERVKEAGAGGRWQTPGWGTDALCTWGLPST